MYYQNSKNGPSLASKLNPYQNKANVNFLDKRQLLNTPSPIDNLKATIKNKSEKDTFGYQTNREYTAKDFGSESPVRRQNTQNSESSPYKMMPMTAREQTKPISAMDTRPTDLGKQLIKDHQGRDTLSLSLSKTELISQFNRSSISPSKFDASLSPVKSVIRGDIINAQSIIIPRDISPSKYKQQYTEERHFNFISEPSEEGSELSWAISDRKSKPIDESPIRARVPTEGNWFEDVSPMLHPAQRQKGSDILSFWGKETTYRKSLKPSKESGGGITDIKNLKKFLLSAEDVSDSPLPSAKNTKADTESVDEVLDGNFTNRIIMTEESPKRSVYSYNPYAEQQQQQRKGSSISSYSEGIKEGSIPRSVKGVSRWLTTKVSSKTEEEPVKNESSKTSKVSFHGKHAEVKKNLNLVPTPVPVKQEEKKKVSTVSIFSLMNTLRIVKKRLKVRYFKNRTEVYKYDPKKDPPVKKVLKRNKELQKKRDKYTREDKKIREKSSVDLLEDCTMEYFDFTGYSSIFGVKDALVVQAYTTDLRYGRLVKAGPIQKVINNKLHQRWLVLRSFNLYCYKGSYSSQADEFAPLRITPLNESYVPAIQSNCLTFESKKGKNVVMVSEDDWKNTIVNGVAHRRYAEYKFKENVLAISQTLEYFENEGCRNLDLSQDNILDPMLLTLIFSSLNYHPKLKEVNLTKCHIRGGLLEELMETLINLTKYNRIEVLNLEANGISKEMINPINRYLSSESSVTLKKLYLAKNPIGDEGLQSLAEILYARFERINSDSKSKLALPLNELDLSGTKLGDQTIFSLITMFNKIAKTFQERGVEFHSEMISLKMAGNLISDNSITAFSRILPVFKGLKELDLSNNVRLTNISFGNLLVNMRKSSVQRLDYLGNEIDVKTLESLFANLADNLLLKRMTITMTQKLIEAFIVDKEVIRDFYKIIMEGDVNKKGNKV